MKRTDNVVSFEPSPACARFIQQQAVALGLSPEKAEDVDRILNEAIRMSATKERVEKLFTTMKYLLLDQNHQPKSCTLEEWAAWQHTDPDLGVDYTVVGDSAIGTKFISVLAHNSAPCWETSVVGGVHHGLREVCSGNREQAEHMHALIVRRVTNAARPSDAD